MTVTTMGLHLITGFPITTPDTIANTSLSASADTGLTVTAIDGTTGMAVIRTTGMVAM